MYEKHPLRPRVLLVGRNRSRDLKIINRSLVDFDNCMLQNCIDRLQECTGTGGDVRTRNCNECVRKWSLSRLLVNDNDVFRIK